VEDPVAAPQQGREHLSRTEPAGKHSPSLEGLGPADICFGLDPDTDRISLQVFMRLFASPDLIRTLAARMNQEEIEDLLRHCTALMGRHLSEAEYHQLFLGEEDGHGHQP
jgi:hypothetical protein